MTLGLGPAKMVEGIVGDESCEMFFGLDRRGIGVGGFVVSLTFFYFCFFMREGIGG